MKEPKIMPFEFLKREKYDSLRDRLQNNKLRNLTESMMIDYLECNQSEMYDLLLDYNRLRNMNENEYLDVIKGFKKLDSDIEKLIKL